MTRGCFFWNISFHRCYQSFQSHERVPFIKCIQTCMFFSRLQSNEHNFSIVWPSSLVWILVYVPFVRNKKHECVCCSPYKTSKVWSDYTRDSVACRKTCSLGCIPKMWLSHAIENFDSSDGRTRSRKPTPLSQKPIFWAFHWNGNNFWLDKTDSVVIWNGFVSDRFLRPSLHRSIDSVLFCLYLRF